MSVLTGLTKCTRTHTYNMCIYVHIYTHACAHMHIHDVYTDTCTYTLCICVHAYTCVHIHTMGICMGIHMCAPACVHIHIHRYSLPRGASFPLPFGATASGEGEASKEQCLPLRTNQGGVTCPASGGPSTAQKPRDSESATATTNVFGHSEIIIGFTPVFLPSFINVVITQRKWGRMLHTPLQMFPLEQIK